MAIVPPKSRRLRQDPIGSIALRPGRAEARGFNHLPRIIAAFPEALSHIVKDTTEHLGYNSQAAAPVQGHARGRPWRKGDPTPGTLRDSMRIRYGKRRGTDLIISGRVDYKAIDPTRREPKHPFSRAVEVGSTRRRGLGGYYRVPNEEFLVPAIIRERPIFVARIMALESLLPK